MASNEPYVFISYAKADLATAEQVEAFLAAKGIRSFRDRVNIPIGKDWSVRIHRALRECDRMVLLLSRTSMPYYKEVHLEWMHFDYERKPIYPLQIEACELFYRLRVYNFIDARADWEG
ncbi:MAG: toll/interleukin-1 receptor domain-containing protein, partial [Blastocatellia bacterium]